MTPQTLAFLRQVLCNQAIPVGDPNFLALAQNVAQALAEIDAAMAAFAAAQAAPDPA